MGTSENLTPLNNAPMYSRNKLESEVAALTWVDARRKKETFRIKTTKQRLGSAILIFEKNLEKLDSATAMI